MGDTREPIVSGRCANVGTVTGIVRVVLNSDPDDLPPGPFVAVCHSASVDMLPVFLRASAIVTNVGGITCHAAIVARELGIPCVVGTRDATTRLRDGQLVVVEATSGEVYLA